MNGSYMTHRAPAPYWFLMGLAAGGAMAVLFTPKSGRDVRTQIRDEFDQKAGQAEEWIEAGKRRVKDQARRVDSAIHAARDAYNRDQTDTEMPA